MKDAQRGEKSSRAVIYSLFPFISFPPSFQCWFARSLSRSLCNDWSGSMPKRIRSRAKTTKPGKQTWSSSRALMDNPSSQDLWSSSAPSWELTTTHFMMRLPVPPGEAGASSRQPLPLHCCALSSASVALCLKAKKGEQQLELDRSGVFSFTGTAAHSAFFFFFSHSKIIDERK